MIESYNKTIGTYASTVIAYVKQALEGTSVIEAKRDVAMGILAGKREDRKVDLPFASTAFTGTFEIDLDRYNYFHHRQGVNVGYLDDAKTKYARVQRFPILLPTEINFWGKDSNIAYGLLSAFMLYNSFNPLILVIDTATNSEHKTSVAIEGVTDQSQDVDPTVATYYNITVELRVEGWFHIVNTSYTVLEIVSRFLDERTEEVLDTVITN